MSRGSTIDERRPWRRTNRIVRPQPVDAVPNGWTYQNNGSGETVAQEFYPAAAEGPLGRSMLRMRLTVTAVRTGSALSSIRVGNDYSPITGPAGDRLWGGVYVKPVGKSLIVPVSVIAVIGGVAQVVDDGLREAPADKWTFCRSYNIGTAAGAYTDASVQIGLDLALGDSVWLTGASLEQGWSEYTGEWGYFDGSWPNATWTGTANFSTSVGNRWAGPRVDS